MATPVTVGPRYPFAAFYSGTAQRRSADQYVQLGPGSSMAVEGVGRRPIEVVSPSTPGATLLPGSQFLSEGPVYVRPVKPSLLDRAVWAMRDAFGD